MASMNENERMEYSVLMSRGRDAERTSHFCWIASGIAATMLLSWGMAAKNPALMLPVIFAVAYGFYTMTHGRQQTRLIGGYVKEFYETSDMGPQWFTRLGHLEIVPGFSASSIDWLSCSARRGSWNPPGALRISLARIRREGAWGGSGRILSP